MDTLAFEHHLVSPQGCGRLPVDGFSATVGGGSCCDELQLSLEIDGERVTGAGFVARGCGAATAAGSAAVTLVRGEAVLDVARIGTREIADELGGLSSVKWHAAELAAEALARALGQATRTAVELAAPAGERTLVAMSGGVDSAVAAKLTADRGDTVAVTLELWSDRENDGERSCCSASAVAQARALAHSMGLPHFTIDLRSEFRGGVVEPFMAAYAAGETPNPCVGCNGHVRLDAMLAVADRLGCQRLATGHYARVVDEAEDGDGAGSRDGRGPLLRLAADPAKDQTYMLAALAPEALARMSFPLGELTKPEVRRLAAEAGLPVAAKADSQDLCFLAGTDRRRFLARHGQIRDRPGAIVDVAGNVLGRHSGQHHFTVGQRRGLGLAAAEPLYVLDKDATSNRVTVAPGAALRTDRVTLRGVELRRTAERVNRVKLRYRSRPLEARVIEAPGAGRHSCLELELVEEADVAAPGQIAVLMDGDRIVGYGTIVRSATRAGAACAR